MIRVFTLIGILGAVSTLASHGAVVQYAGTFTATFNTNNPNYQGIATLSGSWSLSFDESAVPASGSQSYTVPLTTLVLDKVIGLTTFSTSNASARITYTSGALATVIVGGDHDGPSGVLEEDDFLIAYTHPSNSAQFASIGVASIPGAQPASSQSGTFALVPEASTMSLIAGSACLMATRRRRRTLAS